MKQKAVAAVSAAAALVALMGCSSAETGKAEEVTASKSHSSDGVSPLFGVNPCEAIKSTEAASTLGIENLETERTFTDNGSDSCEWSGPGPEKLILSFVQLEHPEVKPDPDSERLTDSLGREAIVLRSKVNFCNVSVGFSDNRWLLFITDLPENKRNATDSSFRTGCDQDVPLIKTIIGRLNWS